MGDGLVYVVLGNTHLERKPVVISPNREISEFFLDPWSLA